MQNSTNMRMLKLLRYLYKKIDENHPTTVSDIIDNIQTAIGNHQQIRFQYYKYT